MGDFSFYPELNTKIIYIFNIHEVLDKIIPEKFDSYLDIVKFILEFFKKDRQELAIEIKEINAIYKKIDHIL